MKYNKEKRLEIGRQIYEDELSRHEAALKYEISDGTAKRYMTDYRNKFSLPPKNPSRGNFSYAQLVEEHTNLTFEELNAMSKEELIREVVKAKVSEARIKKGYSVKGVGADKEFIPLGKKNTK